MFLYFLDKVGMSFCVLALNMSSFTVYVTSKPVSWFFENQEVAFYYFWNTHIKNGTSVKMNTDTNTATWYPAQYDF